MGYINYRGIEASSRVNVPATLLEVGGLLFISILITTVIYVLVALASVAAVPCGSSFLLEWCSI